MAIIHYNVWFSFQAGAEESAELSKTRGLMDEFKTRGMILDYRLLRNRGKGADTRLPEFQIIIEFEDDKQFGLPFDEVKRIGIHLGKHGAMIERVDEFVVEIFEQI